MTYSKPFTHYWIAWAIITFLTFIIPEVVALTRNWQDTLSANVWRMEAFRSGQPVGQWTFPHFAFIAMFAVLAFWLFFHFGFGWWR